MIAVMGYRAEYPADAAAFVRAVAADMRTENDRYYGRAHGRTEVRSLPGALEVAGLMMVAADHRGESDRSSTSRPVEVETRPRAGYVELPGGRPAWITSAGNGIAVWAEGSVVYCAVSGRRHGVRWDFLRAGAGAGGVPAVGDPDDPWWVVSIWSQRPDLLPWETAT